MKDNKGGNEKPLLEDHKKEKKDKKAKTNDME
jgi:hypothetical protein